ncbi:hypothetical protein ANN_26350 [Periplaneta americana]|uniref:Uncharacterized protein n=1 Tax=Periplaneta americana TaxID=6978 RepID=A0ABQ8S6G4_PERAM|nr:hypothetical protein ANN_26350 [Periplaneta americana]
MGDAIKMNANVAPVNFHGRSLDGFRCRYCNEIETLAHVLGSCQHGELLRNSRHHNIRKLIAQALRKKSFEVHEEVHCVASEGGGIRRADVVALDKTNSRGFILDTTVRFEMSQTQPSEVNKEKQQIYEPTIPYLRETYQMFQHNEKQNQLSENTINVPCTPAAEAYANTINSVVLEQLPGSSPQQRMGPMLSPVQTNTPILCMFMVSAMSLNMNDAFRTEGFRIEEYLLSMGLDERLAIAKEGGNETDANQPYFGCCTPHKEQPRATLPSDERDSRPSATLKQEEVLLKMCENIDPDV